ncbi:hypothetical protein RA11412_0326 [Rothia aeria]|uniref:Uncharacterized protein n=1 Tax=Rothia aeria TaxID=172042 RepID=A0A2Z5QW37_9MICC|nr:hypothetical protein RA11412_0326 [Rothia aeria]
MSDTGHPFCSALIVTVKPPIRTVHGYSGAAHLYGGNVFYCTERT